MSSSPSITVQADGSLRFIWSDDLVEMLELGEPNVQRASHVEPTEAGQWMADLYPVGGPVLGPFRLRNDALAAEVEWLKANGF